MQLLVGRPRRHIPREWTQTDEEDRRPTTAYLWDVVTLPHAIQAHAYIEYNNEMDALVPSSVSTCYSDLLVLTLYFVVILNFLGIYAFQVTWRPYESPEMMALQESHGLNSMCFQDKTLWMEQCPLIFYYVVEYHLPSRVIRQFRLEQLVRPMFSSTSVELHRYACSKLYNLHVLSFVYVICKLFF
jgi:hypothetical protein